MNEQQDQYPATLDGPAVSVSDPRELLLGYLDWYRDALFRKLAGLTGHQLRAQVGPLTWAPAGLVKHLGWVERRWLQWGFAALDVVPYPQGGDAEEFTLRPDESADEVFASYWREVDRSRELIAAAALDDRAKVGGRFKSPEQSPSLSRILFHLFQEYARHVGQLDIATELIDGRTGE